MHKRNIIGGIIIMMAFTVGCTPRQQHEQNWKLYSAVTSNNLQGVKEVVQSNKTIDFLDLGDYEITPYAFRDGKPKKDGRALALALQDSDDAVAGALIEAGAPASDPEDTYTYLNDAVCNHSLSLCKQLIESGADVNGGEETPLESLLAFSDPEMTDARERAELLIRNGAQFNNKLIESCLKNEWGYLYAQDVLKWLDDRKETGALEPGLEAAVRGNDSGLQRLIREDRIKNKKETLLFAAANCNVETLELMAEEKYDFSIEDDNGMGLLHIAALCNTEKVVAFLLEKGLNGKQKSENGCQPITYAAIGAKEDTLRLLLDQGYHYQDLTWADACQRGTAESVKLLLKLGYKPTNENCYEGYISSIDSVFDELLKQDIPYNVSYDGDLAVNNATEKHAAKLIQMGAKVSNGTLCQAVEWRNHDLLKELLKKEIKQSHDETTSPLVLAIKCGDLQSVRYLVEDGADVNQKIKSDDVDKTPLHIAAESPSADILKYLLKQGGDVKAKDSEGNTPYEYAKEVGLRDNMKLLKNNIGVK
ncbi:ankyrin repeat domain-containing protein [Anaerovorax odorimutans]|uniref:Ankyrin repeat domain-containing protein n=1 Tax=Anaerovorax odorimutans TaxID=109327 RepID=A0ABT1RK12_9FIRM|nr:ankyrin repeat domain-containing protein [Anaerovorax odorimutans]MCQ4635522.1 ankyrin repeat domain-containing protein [Anaerovorax odorimutans]